MSADTARCCRFGCRPHFAALLFHRCQTSNSFLARYRSPRVGWLCALKLHWMRRAREIFSLFYSRSGWLISVAFMLTFSMKKRRCLIRNNLTARGMRFDVHFSQKELSECFTLNQNILREEKRTAENNNRRPKLMISFPFREIFWLFQIKTHLQLSKIFFRASNKQYRRICFHLSQHHSWAHRAYNDE